MRIDLHTHSTASDGTDAPARVVADAAAAGLDVVALTDHDTTDGWDEAADAAVRHGIVLVRGTEVSARSHGTSVHLLCYLQDPDGGPGARGEVLGRELDRTRTARETRARAMVDLLAVDYPLTWSDVASRVEPGATVGRPHIADALVERGVVPDRSAAFEQLLASGGRYHVPHYAPDVADAVRAVRAAGGVPVLAHPGADARGGIVADAVFDELAAAGLAGLEVHHRDHSAAQVERLTAIARRLELFVTGSSDYHGAGKPNRLGENTTEPDVLARIEEQGVTALVRP